MSKSMRKIQKLKFCKPKVIKINEARLKHLASLGLSLEGKSVLEVGAGIGMLTHFFEDLGCDVLSTEGREANVLENLRRHPHREGRAKTVDLAEPHSHTHLGKFDVVFCYGVLYHLGDPNQCLMDLSEVCKELFLLSSRVFMRDNNKINKFKRKSFYNLRARACRPSRKWIMNILSKYYEFVYITRTQPNHSDFHLNWPATSPTARAVFVASRTKLSLSTLSEKLLMRQKRFER